MPKKIHGRNLQAAINKSRTEPRKNPGGRPAFIFCSLSTLMKIFLSRRHPAPDVTLRFVSVKHLAGFTGKGRVALEKPFGDIWWCQGKNKNPLGKVLFIQVSEKFYKPLIYQFIFFP